MTRRTTWSFIEERAPCGEPGAIAWEYWRGMGSGKPLPDLSDILVSRPCDHMLILWEPLPTKAPGPHLTQPWCCYVNTVIFYVRPHITAKPKPWRDREGVLHHGEVGCFYEWDRVETRFGWDALIEHDGWLFKTGGGTVRWAQRRWWMQQWARRERNDSGPVRARPLSLCNS